MKILFTADWHIKLGQKGVPLEWAEARFRSLFKQIHDIEFDCHVIGGDIFDKLPSLKELALFFEFVKQCKKHTIIFAGNHEATKKGQTFLKELQSVCYSLNNNVVIVLDVIEENFGYIVPYEFIHKKETWEKIPDGSRVFTHVRGEIPPHVKPEIDLTWLSKFSTVFAGDLHSHSNSQKNIVYPGSPITTSFHRSLVSTGYIIIDTDTDGWTWHEFDLPQLIRKTVTTETEMVPTEYHHTIYEIEGSLESLGKVENNVLLDKKIVQRSTEAALILKDKMTEEDELV